MRLLFLPIDIDLTGIEKFQQLDKSIKVKAFNSWWESTLITDKTAEINEFNKITDQLPFTKITALTHKIQTEPVPAHIDVYSSMAFEPGEGENILANEPAGYRFVVYGKTDSLELFTGKEWVTAHVPSVPCCYLINSTTGRHRVKYDENREIIYVRGILDPERHQALIQKSMEKYKEFSISV
jgi:hypothetical protein